MVVGSPSECFSLVPATRGATGHRAAPAARRLSTDGTSQAVRNRWFVPHFLYTDDLFTKTGSGKALQKGAPFTQAITSFSLSEFINDRASNG